MKQQLLDKQVNPRERTDEDYFFRRQKSSITQLSYVLFLSLTLKNLLASHNRYKKGQNIFRTMKKNSLLFPEADVSKQKSLPEMEETVQLLISIKDLLLHSILIKRDQQNHLD